MEAAISKQLSGAEASLVVRLVHAHVDPIAVLLVPCLVGVAGAPFQQRIGDLVVDVLLLEHLLVRELDLPVQVLKARGLAEADKLVVDEAILVELIDVLHNFQTLFLYKVLDKSVSANGKPKANNV